MNFVAIDFETASGKRDSACSLALTVVKENKIVDEFYSLINPDMAFSYRNIQIHGITPERVKNAPKFNELWPHIKDFFEPNKIIVAHNARFDNSVLQKTLAHYQIPNPEFLSIDTLATSRAFYKGLTNYKLNTICDKLNIRLDHHHNALDDCEACANILLNQVENFVAQAIKPYVREV
ncbi:3'-5' exonuclease [Ligilactobacillus cholophilus]|uniref:3'-5' exonuclease n=1 Tax=Ligilactobacillus cholophilus TaxID=3050131 RepID=UPI0025B20C49|nr:3'-5' exonuclease [Ligilactobacillus cholophilus]